MYVCTDRSVGGIDHAIRRRFMHVYCPPTPNLLKDHCKVEDDYSLEDFLSKLNNALNEVLKNKDLAIGHAVFLKSGLSISKWSYNELEKVLNYKIIPTIEEYCNGDNYKITQILGKQLPRRLKNGKFIAAMKEFISQ